MSSENGYFRIRLSSSIKLPFLSTTIPRLAEPDRWLRFLNELWPNEPAAIKVLGEWFGYVISGRTDLHKILLMVGPTRGGKGAIARVLSALVGRKNVAGPTLNSLGGEFGLAPLIGKPLAIISDARFAGKDASVVVERLLSISGEDTLTVNRKYREQWTGKLPSRLHVLSNELPKLGDASTAIVGRIVLLLLSHSWLGREDHELEPALHAQLTGILNWALAGLHRLTVDNKNAFTRVASADEAIIEMRDLASPVAAFVREKCETGSNKEVPVDTLYAAYVCWAEDNGHAKTSKQTFGRNLRAVVPGVKVERPRDEDDRDSASTPASVSPSPRPDGAPGCVPAVRMVRGPTQSSTEPNIRAAPAHQREYPRCPLTTPGFHAVVNITSEICADHADQRHAPNPLHLKTPPANDHPTPEKPHVKNLGLRPNIRHQHLRETSRIAAVAGHIGRPTLNIIKGLAHLSPNTPDFIRNDVALAANFDHTNGMQSIADITAGSRDQRVKIKPRSRPERRNTTADRTRRGASECCSRNFIARIDNCFLDPTVVAAARRAAEPVALGEALRAKAIRGESGRFGQYDQD